MNAPFSISNVIDTLMEYAPWIGVSISLIVTAAFSISSRGERIPPGVKHYLNQNKWQGQLYTSQIESWTQTNTTCGNDFFYDIYFYHQHNLRSASALIKPGEMHYIRKGLPIIVKLGKRNQAVVISVNMQER